MSLSNKNTNTAQITLLDLPKNFIHHQIFNYERITDENEKKRYEIADFLINEERFIGKVFKISYKYNFEYHVQIVTYIGNRHFVKQKNSKIFVYSVFYENVLAITSQRNAILSHFSSFRSLRTRKIIETLNFPVKDSDNFAYYWDLEKFIELIKESNKLPDSIILCHNLLQNKKGSTIKTLSEISNIKDFIVLDSDSSFYDELTIKALKFNITNLTMYEKLVNGSLLFISYGVNNTFKFSENFDTEINYMHLMSELELMKKKGKVSINLDDITKSELDELLSKY